VPEPVSDPDSPLIDATVTGSTLQCAMPTVSQDLAPRGAALEYWFIKFHAGDLAFLVDFIVRRDAGQSEVRVSLWVRGQGRVAHAFAAHEETGRIGDCTFSADSTRGCVEDIEWDISYDAGASRVAPRAPLFTALKAFDLDLLSRPQAVFGGAVTVGGERFALSNVAGSVTHYWGRRLPDRWRWISANAFGGTDLVVEATLMRTRVWGQRPAIAAGYLWTNQDGLLVSPVNGLLTVRGTWHDYVVTARSFGRTTRWHCVAQPERDNDLGEGIHQTLLGTCTRLSDGVTDAQAGLEYRR
jgi:hypothetical protein